MNTYETFVLITAALVVMYLIVHVAAAVFHGARNFVYDEDKKYPAWLTWEKGNYWRRGQDVVLTTTVLFLVGAVGSLAWFLFWPALIGYISLRGMRAFVRLQKKVDTRQELDRKGHGLKYDEGEPKSYEILWEEGPTAAQFMEWLSTKKDAND